MLQTSYNGNCGSINSITNGMEKSVDSHQADFEREMIENKRHGANEEDKGMLLRQSVLHTR